MIYPTAHGPSLHRIASCSTNPRAVRGRLSRFVGQTMLLAIVFLMCCDKPAAPVAVNSAPTVASLVPAATDLLVGMGATDRLVAVSTYDRARADVGTLPKAGNYETIDWELLRSLHPSVLVTEISTDRQSPGFKANAADLNIKPLNVKIETLDDIFTALDQLGQAIDQPQAAQQAKEKMQARLDAVRQSVANLKPVRTLLVISPTADGVVGTGTYLDDLLKIAGGVNAVAPEQGHWPTIDREKLLSLSPDVILQLLPADTSPQERAQASAVWKQLSQIPAVAHGRVYPIYEPYALVPGWHVTDLAEVFARDLHPTK